MAIKNDHFSEVAEILASPLDDNGLSLEDRNALMDVVAPTYGVIVNSAELAA
ncbi:hypothetical protein N9O95_01915 [Alphaproteobacteria bacterium]|nr:hypothetical protein [Alphaproteobacteria bacterium]